MRIPSPLIWFKALAGSTSAKVALSVRSPTDGVRFIDAFIAIHNRETRLTQAWRHGELSVTRLVDQSRRLTDLHQKLIGEASPAAHSQSMQDLLTRISNRPPEVNARSLSGSLESLVSREQFRGRALSALADEVWSSRLNSLKSLRTEVLATADLIAKLDSAKPRREVVAEVFDALQARAPVGSGLGVEWSVVRYLRQEMLTNSDGPDGRVATDRLPVARHEVDRSASLPAQLTPPADGAPPKPPRAASVELAWRPGETSI